MSDTGMHTVTLDMRGRLLGFHAVPPQFDDRAATARQTARRRPGSRCSTPPDLADGERSRPCRRSGRRATSPTRAPPGKARCPNGRTCGCVWKPPPTAAGRSSLSADRPLDRADAHDGRRSGRQWTDDRLRDPVHSRDRHAGGVRCLLARHNVRVGRRRPAGRAARGDLRGRHRAGDVGGRGTITCRTLRLEVLSFSATRGRCGVPRRAVLDHLCRARTVRAAGSGPTCMLGWTRLLFGTCPRFARRPRRAAGRRLRCGLVPARRRSDACCRRRWAIRPAFRGSDSTRPTLLGAAATLTTWATVILRRAPDRVHRRASIRRAATAHPPRLDRAGGGDGDHLLLVVQALSVTPILWNEVTLPDRRRLPVHVRDRAIRPARRRRSHGSSCIVCEAIPFTLQRVALVGDDRRTGRSPAIIALAVFGFYARALDSRCSGTSKTENLSRLEFLAGPRRRRRGPRILRPRMLRVAAAQLLPHLRIRAIPEAAQIARELDRPAVRREQREDDGFALTADARRLGQAEQLLQLHRRRHAAVVVVLERDASVRSGRRATRARRDRARARRPARAPARCARRRARARRRRPRARARRRRRPGRRTAAAAAAARRRPGARARARRRRAAAPRSRDRPARDARRARARRSDRRRPPAPCRSPCRSDARPLMRSAASHSRSTRLAMRTRANCGLRIADCGFDCGLRLTSSATRNSPSRTPLSGAMVAPVPDASSTFGEPGSRRCATRSGYPARIARRKSASRETGSPIATTASPQSNPQSAIRDPQCRPRAARAAARSASRRSPTAGRTSWTPCAAAAGGARTAARRPAPSAARRRRRPASAPAADAAAAAAPARPSGSAAAPRTADCGSDRDSMRPRRSSSVSAASSASSRGRSNHSSVRGSPPQAITSSAVPARSIAVDLRLAMRAQPIARVPQPPHDARAPAGPRARRADPRRRS